MSKSVYYRIWFQDGSHVLFRDDQMDAHALRFGFHAEDLRNYGEVTLDDEDGNIIGGVMLEDGL